MSLVPSLTVAENIFLGRMPKKGSVIDWKKANEEASRLLHKMGVEINPREIVSRLSMWQCQVVEITKAMSFHPKVLMLDEPSLGLAPLVIKDIFRTLQEIRAEGTTILIVEQNALATLKIADVGYVLELGKISMKGPAGELIHDERLVEAYLGNKKK